MILNPDNSPSSRSGRAALILMFILAGCATGTDLQVDISKDFPSPLVVPAPVHMGIFVPAVFEQYVFEEFEKIPQKPAKKKSKKQKPKKQKQKQKPAEDADSQASGANAEQEDKVAGGSEVAGKGEASAKQGKEDSVTSEPEQEVQSEENTSTADEVEKAAPKPRVQQRLKMRVALGEAQARMVRAVLPPVFERATMLESLAVEARPSGMDLYVVPEIKRLQYTTPKSTRTKVYEIWLQYDFVIYDRNDDVVTRWNLPCYGKTPSQMMKSQKDALHAATQMALRDCGAAFSTGFSVHPAVQRWMQAEEKRQQRAMQRTES